MNFLELGLKERLAKRLADKNIVTPTPIQAEVFALIAEGKAVLGLSKTGTGKTFAFLCPVANKIEDNGINKPQAVVLVPTRELAVQIQRDLETLCGASQKAAVIVGGEPEDSQVRAAEKATWLVATPGRLLDLLKRRMVDVSALQFAVFDEADRLLDMGFQDEIRAIMKLLPKNMQMLFFSATLHFGVDEMAYEFGAECHRVGEPAEEMTVEGLDHSVSFVGDQEKFHALVWFLHQQDKAARGIVFSNYREKVHEISARLQGLGLECASLTAQLTQAVRNRIMDDFRAGKTRVLMASDLASRGLDVFDIDFVVNYDLSEDPAIYVHRVGRTARAGRKGSALSFVGFEDSFRMEKLERYLGKPLPRVNIPGEALQGKLARFADAPAPERYDRPQQQQGSSPRTSGGESRNHSHGKLHQHGGQPRRDHAPKASVQTARPATKPTGFLQKIWHQISALWGAKPQPAKPVHSAKPVEQASHSGGGRSSGGSSGRGRGGGRGRRSGPPSSSSSPRSSSRRSRSRR